MSISWTPKPRFCGGRAYLKLSSTGICTILCALALSACGESTPRGYAGSPSTSTSDTLKPIALPPGAADRPALPGTTGMEKTADGLPVLSPKGVNTALFTGKVNDDNRFVRLENAVQELRNDFDAMAPAIVRLVSIEKDIQNLIAQLDVLTGGAVSAPAPSVETSELEVPDPTRPAPIPAAIPDAQEMAAASSTELEAAPQTLTPTPPTLDAIPEATSAPAQIVPQTAATPTPAQAAAATAPAHSTFVKDVRIGEHPGKMRIVLDLKGSSKFSVDLDNAEHILVIELPETSWNTANTKEFSGNSLLSSYRTSPLNNGTGTMMILQLKKASNITYKTSIADPDGVSSRIVIDLSL